MTITMIRIGFIVFMSDATCNSLLNIKAQSLLGSAPCLVSFRVSLPAYNYEALFAAVSVVAILFGCGVMRR